MRPAAASGFEQLANGVHALFDTTARPRVPITARVVLPNRATGDVVLTDETSGLSIRFRLQGASDVPVAATQGMAVYGSAYAGGDVVHRVSEEGTEDFVVLGTQPAHRWIDYELELSHAAGLRLVADTLELLDEGGTPRLRVAPPRVDDAHGVSRPAGLAVIGCSVDTSPSAPWGRPIVSPGASRCGLRVSWDDAQLSYPLIVDPVWLATASLTEARYWHTASLLSTGKVLVAGGFDTSAGPASTAELYDPVTATWAATGSLATARFLHAATMLASGKSS